MAWQDGESDDDDDGRTGATPAPPQEYWKQHWDYDHKRWHGRGQRVGPPGGGSDTKPGLHTKGNAAEKARKSRKSAERAEEDRRDPAGADGRAQARLEQRVAHETLGYARKNFIANAEKLAAAQEAAEAAAVAAAREAEAAEASLAQLEALDPKAHWAWPEPGESSASTTWTWHEGWAPNQWSWHEGWATHEPDRWAEDWNDDWASHGRTCRGRYTLTAREAVQSQGLTSTAREIAQGLVDTGGGRLVAPGVW